MTQAMSETKRGPSPAPPPIPSRDGSISAFGKARATIAGSPLSADELQKIHAYWRACNYLALGMTYLKANPLLKEPLKADHIKDRLLGHWGASPGLAFAYIHLDRAIKAHDLDVVYMAGPGHGAPGVLGAVLPGRVVFRNLSRLQRRRGRDAAALQALLIPRRDR